MRQEMRMDRTNNLSMWQKILQFLLPKCNWCGSIRAPMFNTDLKLCDNCIRRYLGFITIKNK